WIADRQSCVRPTTTSSAPSANSIIETFGDSETTRHGVCICASPLLSAPGRRWRRSVAPDWLYSRDGCACTRREHCVSRTLHVGGAGQAPRRPPAQRLCRPAWRRNETHGRAPFPQQPVDNCSASL